MARVPTSHLLSDDEEYEQYLKKKSKFEWGTTHYELTKEKANDFKIRVYTGLNPLLALRIINDFYKEKFKHKVFYTMWETEDGKLGPEDVDSHLIEITAEKYLKDHSIPRYCRIADLEQGVITKREDIETVRLEKMKKLLEGRWGKI